MAFVAKFLSLVFHDLKNHAKSSLISHENLASLMFLLSTSLLLSHLLFWIPLSLTFFLYFTNLFLICYFSLPPPSLTFPSLSFTLFIPLSISFFCFLLPLSLSPLSHLLFLSYFLLFLITIPLFYLCLFLSTCTYLWFVYVYVRFVFPCFQKTALSLLLILSIFVNLPLFFSLSLSVSLFLSRTLFLFISLFLCIQVYCVCVCEWVLIFACLEGKTTDWLFVTRHLWPKNYSSKSDIKQRQIHYFWSSAKKYDKTV